MKPMSMEEHAEAAIRDAANLDQLALPLQHLLNAGLSVLGGRLIFIRQRVGQINGLKIEIYPREHPPPHFHIKGADVDATFSIIDCTQLTGNVDKRDYDLIKWWYERSRPQLVNVWNATRPSDCPVGPIDK